MATNEPYFTYAAPAYDLYEDDGTTVIPAIEVMMSHTGTLDTTGHGDGDITRTGTLYGVTVDLGPDTSAAGINPLLEPDLTPLPEGYVAGPTLTGPIY